MSKLWLPILRRKGVPTLFYSYINHGYQREYYQELLGASHGNEYHQYVDGWVVIHLEESERFTSDFIPRLGEPAYVQFFLRQCARVSDELISFGDTVRGKDYTGADPATLLYDFMRFSSFSIHVMPFLNTMVFVQEAIEERLRRVLSLHFGIEETSPDLTAQMQSLMLEGSQAPLATQALAELSAMAAQIDRLHPRLARHLREEATSVTRRDIEEESAELWHRVVNYLLRYDFLGTDYYLGEPTTLTELCDQLAVFLAKPPGFTNPAEGLRAGGNAERLSESDAALLKAAQTMQYLREYRLEALFKAGCDCRALLWRIGEALGVSYDELMYMTFDEIQRSLSSGAIIVELASVRERMAGYGSIVEGGIASIVVGQQLAAMRRVLPDPPEATDALSGVTAYPGECIGTARVIDHLSKTQELEVGDILVAPMTLPYHVPAMARAAAVLTDEGGILSHAAIVCRELRIPCIVGLGSATTAFAKGDRVHVQATPARGLVERVPSP